MIYVCTTLLNGGGFDPYYNLLGFESLFRSCDSVVIPKVSNLFSQQLCLICFCFTGIV